MKNRTEESAKYESSNPVVRWMVQRFMDGTRRRIDRLGPSSILDLGCGEGTAAALVLPSGIDYRGVDRSEELLRRARQRLPQGKFHRMDFMAGELPDEWRSELVLCLEVLEHVSEPSVLLRKVARLGQVALLTVPWEPYFQVGNLLRGKYPATLGNHPDHVQRFGRGSFLALLRHHFAEADVDTCFPWLVALCRCRSTGRARSSGAPS